MVSGKRLKTIWLAAVTAALIFVAAACSGQSPAASTDGGSDVPVVTPQEDVSKREPENEQESEEENPSEELPQAEEDPESEGPSGVVNPPAHAREEDNYYAE